MTLTAAGSEQGQAVEPPLSPPVQQSLPPAFQVELPLKPPSTPPLPLEAWDSEQARTAQATFGSAG